MSVESNRAKVRRYAERHPDYYRKKRLRTALRKQKLLTDTSSFQTFEVADPRDPGRPRIISWGLITNRPVWKPFLDLQDICRAPWAAWLRELSKLGLQPVERAEWSIGRILPISKKFAEQCAKTRIEQLNRLHTGNPKIAPLWLLHIPRGRYYYVLPAGEKPPRRYVRPVGYVKDGCVERFRCIEDAPVDPKTAGLVSWCGTDTKGRTWFYD